MVIPISSRISIRRIKKLAKDFVDAIKRLVKRVKSFVTNRYANTEYGKALLQVTDDLYSQIQQLWNEAVESGLEAANAQKADNKKAANEGGVKLQARKGASRGIFSSKSIDEYTRSQYNSFGWVVINKVLTVNELNRFYKQFGDKKALQFVYKKSIDGYYMIPTGDISMVDSKIVFVSGTLQNPYIDRVVEVTGIDDNEKTYYINEVIDNEEYDGSYDDIEAYAGEGVFRTYTQTDFASYSELKRRYNAKSNKDSSKQDIGERDSKESNGIVKYQGRTTDTDYLSAVERGDMETAQRMVDEAQLKKLPQAMPVTAFVIIQLY